MDTDDLPDDDADTAAILARVRLRCAAPAAIQQDACRRHAGGEASWLMIPASTLMHSSVCPRASDRISGAIFFRGKCLWLRHRARKRCSDATQ
jgi:hypothetical protein